MIKSFKDKETEKLWDKGCSLKIPVEIQHRSLKKLEAIDTSADLEDLKFPRSNYLEQLRGNRQWQYSIRINDKYRICFTWIDSDAYDVEIVNYH